MSLTAHYKKELGSQFRSSSSVYFHSAMVFRPFEELDGRCRVVFIRVVLANEVRASNALRRRCLERINN